MTVPLWQSRAFLTLLVDSIFSLITLVGGQMAGWNMVLVGGIIAILQPLFIAAVVSFTKEDTVKLLMGVHPVQLLPNVVSIQREFLVLRKLENNGANAKKEALVDAAAKKLLKDLG